MSSCTRAAASSIASGIPSSRAADLRDRRRAFSVGDLEADGTTARARSTNSCTASHWSRSARGGSWRRSGRDSDGTRQITSPGIRSGSRLVARMRRCGQARSRALGQPCAGGDQVLAVVEEEQQVLGLEKGRQGLDQRLAGRLAHAKGRGDGLGHQRRVGERGQLDQPDAIRVARELGSRRLDRQPGLAAAAGAGQGEQPGGGEQSLDLGDLALASDEARQSDWQVV